MYILYTIINNTPYYVSGIHNTLTITEYETAAILFSYGEMYRFLQSIRVLNFYSCFDFVFYYTSVPHLT